MTVQSVCEYILPKQMSDRLGKDFLNRLNELNKEKTMDNEVKSYTFQVKSMVEVYATSLDDALEELREDGYNVDNLDEVRWVD